MTFYLYINGVLKNQETYNISLGSLTVGYSGPWEFSFTQHKKFDQKDFDFEDTVRLETHNPTVIRFEGNIKQIQCTGGASENIKYTCLGLKKRIEEVVLEKNDNMEITYNKDGETEPNKVGYVIKNGFEAMKTIMRQRIPNFYYTNSQFDAMQVKIPADTACRAMNMLTFFETFLDYQQDYRCYIDPNTKKIEYVNMDSLSALSVSVSADGNKSFNVKPDVSGCYTKVKLQGPHYIERCDFYDPNNVGGSTLAKDSATEYHSKAITSGVLAGRFDEDEDEFVPCAFSTKPRFVVTNNAGTSSGAPKPGTINESGGIAFDQDPNVSSGYRLYVRYTYKAAAIEAESSYAGTAYAKGVEKTLAEYLFDYQKIELKGIVTYIPGSPNLYIRDTSMYLPQGDSDADPLKLYDKTIVVGGHSKTIWKYGGTNYGGLIYLNNLTGIALGDTFSVASRDDLTELQALRDILKDEYKDIQYIETIVLSSLNFNYCLGKKVRLTNSSDSDFLTYAPIIKVTYDLANENTTINLTQDPKLQFNEALRRELAKRKKEEENTKVKTAKMSFIYK